MLQHSDGFDSHLTGAATLSDGDPGWLAQAGVTITATGGKFGGKSLQRAAAVAGYARFENPGAEKAFAAYVKFGTFGGAAQADVLRMGPAGQRLLTVDNTGVIRVYDGGGTARITTAAGAYVASAYPWIEVDFRTSEINLFVNGLPLGSYTGAYTSIGSTFEWLGAAPANTPATDLDDAIAWDASGSYFNGMPVTPRRIFLQRPSADGDVIQWTPTSGTNWQAVDDTDWSGGVGVTAEVGALKDVYQLTDLGATPASIDAVVVKTKVQNTGDNPAQLQHVVRNTDGTESVSGLQAVPTVAPAVLKSVFYRDPAGQLWTTTLVNALQAGQISSN